MKDDELDKDIPMKIIGHWYCRCGRCGAMLFEGKERCDNCGQMIDWSTRQEDWRCWSSPPSYEQSKAVKLE